MSEYTLTGTRLFEGVWEGVLTSRGDGAAPPDIEVTLAGEPLDGVEILEDPEAGHWVLQVPVPSRALADGVQTFVIRDAAGDEPLGNFCIIAGEAAGGDIRAELDLLRAEMDMLKRAFRTHCAESS